MRVKDNKIAIYPTKFTDLPSNNESFGFRICDAENFVYCNMLDTREELPDDPLGFLRVVIENAGEKVLGMLEDCINEEDGLFINDEWFDYSQIADILKEM